MSRFIAVPSLDRQAWQALSRRGLGGSDAATLVGLNPYDSLPALYARKKGLMEQPATPAMQVGLALEPLVAQLWQEATGKRCRQVRGMYVDGEKDYFRAHVQRKWWGKAPGSWRRWRGPSASWT